MSEMDRETIIQKLKKIEALAAAGMESERVAAELALARMLKKYGIQPEELKMGEPTEMIRFVFKNKGEYEVFLQICFIVLDTNKIRVNRNISGYGFTIELTRAQRIEIEQNAKYYIAEYRKELASIKKNFAEAFILRNLSDAPPADERTEPKFVSEEDARRIKFLMFSGEKLARPVKLLEASR